MTPPISFDGYCTLCVYVVVGLQGVVVCGLKGLKSLEFASCAEWFVVEETLELERGGDRCYCV